MTMAANDIIEVFKTIQGSLLTFVKILLKFLVNPIEYLHRYTSSIASKILKLFLL